MTVAIRDNPVVWPPRFSAGQLAVLHELASGKTDVQIAHALDVARSTVHKRILRMYRRARVSSRVALAVWAPQENVIELDDIRVECNYPVNKLERWTGEA